MDKTAPQTNSTRAGRRLGHYLVDLGVEARVGIEPTHKGFADLSLTTWVPRLGGPFAISALQIVGEVYRRQGTFGAGDRGRTGDIFLGKEALYH